MATSAAAPPPTALNSDTSWGIAVIFTARAQVQADAATDEEADDDDASTRSMVRPPGRRASQTSVATTAMVMPAGRQLVAVAGRGRAVHLVQTDDEQRGADEPGEEDESCRARCRASIRLPCRRVAGLGGGGLLLEHLEHPVGDHVAAHHVGGAEHHGDEGEHVGTASWWRWRR